MKRALSTTNTCKAYKYEAAGVMYAKKIDELEKQNTLIDAEIKNIQDEINGHRKNTMRQKRD